MASIVAPVAPPVHRSLPTTALHPLGSPARERRDAHPVLHTVVKDQIGEWLDRRVGLGIDVDPGVREALSISSNRRIGSVPRRELRDLGPREVDDPTGAVGHSVELVVVERDQTPSAVA